MDSFMSRLLYGLLIATSSIASASILTGDYLKKPTNTKIGVEIGVNNVDISWGVDTDNQWSSKVASGDNRSDLEYISALSRNSVHLYENIHGEFLHPTLGLRAYAKVRVYEVFDFETLVGVETTLPNARGFRPSGDRAGLAYGKNIYTDQPVPYNELHSIWRQDTVTLTSTAMILYQGVGFGIGYETRKYSISGHNTDYALDLNRSKLKDDQFLVTFRAEAPIGSAAGIDFDLVFDFSSNMCDDAGSDIEDYYKDMYQRIGVSPAFGTASAAGTADTSSYYNTFKVTTVDTRIYKAAVSIACKLYDLNL